jgi:hypothetical protein
MRIALPTAASPGSSEGCLFTVGDPPSSRVFPADGHFVREPGLGNRLKRLAAGEAVTSNC